MGSGKLALTIFVLAVIARAAAPRDIEAELIETTYRLKGNGDGEITYHERLKAATAQGRMAISQIHVNYFSGDQDVEFRSVRTVKKDGAVVQGDVSAAFDTPSMTDPLAPYFTDLKAKTIIPPNVDTGDAVEYEAVLHIHKWEMPGEFWFEHDATKYVPVARETVVLDLPAGRRISIFESIPGDIEMQDGRRIERWSTWNREPAANGAPPEPPLFAVSSVQSWDAYGEWVRSLHKSAVEPTPEITELAAKLTANKTGEQERIAALYDYVATKVRYVGIAFGIGKFQPHAAAAVLHNAYGDCKDQATLLTALLKAAGFKAHPVLMTPFAGVLAPDVPMPQFSHEFTAVETKNGLEFLDTSMGPVEPQVLQPGARGRTALLIGERNASILEVPKKAPVPLVITNEFKGRVSATGAFEGTARVEVQGVVEAALRRVFFDGAESDKENIVRLAGVHSQKAKVRQLRSSDPADLSGPFWIQAELSDPEFFPASQTSIKIAPTIQNFSAEALESRAKPDRALPLEPMITRQRMDLIVDPLFTIDTGMPLHRKSAFGSYDSEFTYENGHLRLERSLEFNGAAIGPADWDAFFGFLQAAREEIARGFSLERHLSAPRVGSPLTRALQEGNAALQARNFEAAKRAYLDATKLDPQSHDAWNELGRAYSGLRQYDEAEKAYKRQIEVFPQTKAAYNNLGLVYRTLKRDDEAMQCFRKQIEVSPRYGSAHSNLADLLWTQKRWAEARDEAEIAAEIAPDDPSKWQRLGRAQAKTGQIEAARKSFEKALGMPHDAMLENNVAYEMANAGFDLERAWSLVAGALGPEARQVCEPKVLSKEDKCSAGLRRISILLDTAGWVLYRQGKFADAEPYLRSAYAVAPRAEAGAHVALELERLGRHDEALRRYAEISLMPDFARVDSDELVRELGPAADEGRVAIGSAMRVIALVDETGKVVETQALNSDAPDSVVEQARSLRLAPIAWPGHALRSIRTVEFRRNGDAWSVVRSFVGVASTPE